MTASQERSKGKPETISLFFSSATRVFCLGTFFVPGSGIITRSLYTIFEVAGRPLFEALDVALAGGPRFLLLKDRLPWFEELLAALEPPDAEVLELL